MDQVLSNICDNIGALWDKGTRARVESVLKLFLNRRSKGNRMLLLGLKNKKYIIERIGRSGEEFIKDDASYIIKITKSNKDAICLSFNKCDNDITAERQSEIKDMFNYYGCQDVDLDSYFANGEIPMLKIHQDLDWLIQNRHNCLRILMGEGLVGTMTIETNHKVNNGLISSVDEISIIPENCRLLTENSRNQSNGIHESFWEYISKNNIGINNYYMFNFVVLNSVNDHLIRCFVELQDHYRKHFSKSDEARVNDAISKLIKRVFFISSDDLLNESRYEEKWHMDIKSFRNDIDSLENEICDAEAYSQILDIITCAGKEGKGLDAEDCRRRLGTVRNRLLEFRNYLTESMPVIQKYSSEYNDLDHSILSLEDKDIDERELMILYLSNCTEKLSDFAQHYSPNKVEDVTILLNDIKDFKPKAILKTGTLIKTYNIKDKEYESWINEKIHLLKKILDDIKSDISIRPINSIEGTLDYSSFILSDNDPEKTPNSVNALIVGEVIGQFKNTLWTLSKELSKFKAEINHDTVMTGISSKAVQHMIDSINEEITKGIDNDLSPEHSRIRETDYRTLQWNIEAYIRDLIREILERQVTVS